MGKTISVRVFQGQCFEIGRFVGFFSKTSVGIENSGGIVVTEAYDSISN